MPGTQTFTGLWQSGSSGSPGMAYQSLPDVVATGSFGLTANGCGTVALVSPSRVSIDGAAWQRRSASFGTLKLGFVPEPGA